MEERNVYLYWVGKEYSLLSILRKLMYIHSKRGKGYNIHLITDKNIQNYVQDIPPYFTKLCPAHQADFVRVSVLCAFGGIWLDSDTLVMDSLDTLFDCIEHTQGFFIRENNSILWNGIFGSKANTPLMIEWKTNVRKTLDAKQTTIRWSEIGCRMLQSMYDSNPTLYTNYKIFNGLDNLYPVYWKTCVENFLRKPYDNYRNILREYQPLVVLVHSVYRELQHATEQEILQSDMPLNYFLNTSLQNGNISKNKLLFDNIYETHLWNNSDSTIPLSGPGSSIEHTKACSNMLHTFIYSNNCTSVLDIGCGDLTWMSHTQFFRDPNIHYTGVDVVERLIRSHSLQYPNNTFLCKDITLYKDIEFASVIVIRDVIFHLKNKEILAIFENIRNKFQFLCITNCKNETNTDAFDRWNFAEKNIHMAPFHKSHKYTMKLEEPAFKRNVYIYTHDSFYDL